MLTVSTFGLFQSEPYHDNFEELLIAEVFDWFILQIFERVTWVWLVNLFHAFLGWLGADFGSLWEGGTYTLSYEGVVCYLHGNHMTCSTQGILYCWEATRTVVRNTRWVHLYACHVFEKWLYVSVSFTFLVYWIRSNCIERWWTSPLSPSW